jgi:hypothetical protein
MRRVDQDQFSVLPADTSQFYRFTFKILKLLNSLNVLKITTCFGQYGHPQALKSSRGNCCYCMCPFDAHVCCAWRVVLPVVLSCGKQKQGMVIGHLDDLWRPWWLNSGNVINYYDRNYRNVLISFFVYSPRAGTYSFDILMTTRSLAQRRCQFVNYASFNDKSILLFYLNHPRFPCCNNISYYFSSQYSNWLWAGRPRGRSSSPFRVKNYLFTTSSRPALGPIQPPIQWVPGAAFPGV